MEAVKREHELIVAVSPHVKSEESVSRIMWSVNLSLLPALVMGIYFFGPKATLVTALCIMSAVLSEYLVEKALKRKVTVAEVRGKFIAGNKQGANV